MLTPRLTASKLTTSRLLIVACIALPGLVGGWNAVYDKLL